VTDPAIEAAIREKALDLGFDAMGFAKANLDAQISRHLSDFLESGFHGDMGWLQDRCEERSNPRALWPKARSVIALGLNYGPAGDPLAHLTCPERGGISVYARGRDYHDVFKKKLRVLARFIADDLGGDVKLFVDTAPVMEKPLAQKAGLGWQGKHTNLVSRRWGSWLFLGEIYTDLDLEPDAAETDHCGGCQNCLDVCPTKAFTGPYKLNAQRCISYLTIEHPSHIPREFRTAIGNRIYGCDDCLTVCPWNKFAKPTDDADLSARLELTWPRLADLVQLNDTDFRTVFSRSPVKRLGRNRFIRNVLIAIGNSGLATLIPHAKLLLDDPSPLVRAMAVWALSQLMEKDTFTALSKQFSPAETNPDVRTEWQPATGSSH
jgi:epoxyqueuosine reductase